MLSAIHSLIKKRQNYLGVNDFLSYLMLIDERTVLHKDAGLSMHFSYQPPDLESSTDNDLDSYAQAWRQSFGFLGDGWMVETNVLSQQFSLEDEEIGTPELVSTLIAEERKLQCGAGQYFNTQYVLSISYKPNSEIASHFRAFALEKTNTDSRFEEEITRFKIRVEEFIGFLRKAASIKPLVGNDLISFLYQTITGRAEKLANPFQGAFLDCYLAADDLFPSDKPMLGNQHIRILSIDELPTFSYPCILDLLNHLPIAYRWSSRFITLDKLTSQNYLKRYERNWSSKAIGLIGVMRESMGMDVRIDRDAERTAEQLRETQSDNNSGIIHYGFYNSVIVLMDEDEAHIEQVAKDIKNQIQQLNFRVRIEGINSVDAYIGSLPGHGGYNVRKMMVDTQFVGHALPMSGVYQGEFKAPCPYYGDAPGLLLCGTQGSRPFWLNLHVNDVGHTAILGPTGSGKSTLIGALITAHRQYTSSRIIILDKDHSHRFLIKAMQGEYFDLANRECQLAPLSFLKPDDVDAQAMVSNWLAACCIAQGVTLNPVKYKAIQDAVDLIAFEDPQYKTLSHLCLQDPELREAISVYAEGDYKDLLNGKTSLMTSSDIIGFDVTSLIQDETKKSLPIIKALTNELEIAFRDKRPTLLVLEEAWLYLRDELFREKLTDWFKTLRKSNVAVIFISQDISDIAQSDAASIIQNSCMTRIYLPNQSAQEPAVKQLYSDFGLNERQISLIQQAIPKCDYYYSSPLGNRLFRLNLADVAKAFLCVSSKNEIELFNQLFTKNGDSWILDWLKERKLHEWSDYVEKNYLQ